MSLEEKLQLIRQEKQAQEEAIEAETAETQKQQQEREETERVEVLRSQISDLKNKKTELESSLASLKEGYESAGGAIKGFKQEDANIASFLEKNKLDLAENGITSKDKLIKSPDFSEDEEIKKYKEAGADLREKVGGVRSAKQAINQEIPDLNFSGGIAKETPEEIADRESRIAEFQTRNDAIVANMIKIREQFGENFRDIPEYKAHMDEVESFQRDLSAAGLKEQNQLKREGDKDIITRRIIESPVEKKTPREQSIEKVETHIEELGKQIEALEEQTPERIEERKNTAECLTLLQRENRLPNFSGYADSIKTIDQISIVPQNDTIDYYSKQFGEKALKRALFEGLSPLVDKMVQAEKAIFESNNAKYGGSGVFNEKQIRGRVENMLQKKIEIDFAKEKAEKFEEANKAKSIAEQAKSIREKKEVAESQLPQVVRMQLSYKDRLDEEVKLTQSSSSRLSGYSPAKVEYLGNESSELIELQKQLEEVDAKRKESQELYGKKLAANKKFFGPKTSESDLQSIEEDIRSYAKNMTELTEQIESQKRKDATASKKISDLSEITMTTGLVEGKGYKNMTIGQLLEEAKGVLEGYQSQKLTPEQEEIRKKYYEIQEELMKADREYSIAKEKI